MISTPLLRGDRIIRKREQTLSAEQAVAIYTILVQKENGTYLASVSYPDTKAKKRIVIGAAWWVNYEPYFKAFRKVEN